MYLNEKTSDKTSWLYVIVPILLLAATGLLIYYRTAGHDFIYSWDDSGYVADNPFIRSVSFENLKSVFTRPFVANYFPVQVLSYMLDYSIWGLDPYGYHLMNILLHAANSALACVVIHRLTSNMTLAFFAAMAFAVHPINVEVVAWVSQRKMLLSAFFFFITMLCYIHWRGSSKFIYYLAAVVFSILSVFSKTTTVAIPLILASYELLWFPAKQRRLLYLVPFFIVASCGAAGSIWASLAGGSISGTGLKPAFLFGTIYPTMLPVYWKYMFLLIWPTNLSAFYDTATYNSFLQPAVAASLITWGAVFAAVLWKGDRQLRFWFLWAWLLFLPSANILPLPVYYADRYMYLPQIGCFVCAGILLSFMFRAVPAGYGKKLTAVFLLLLFVLGFWTATTLERTKVWSDDITLWEDTAEKSPGMYRVHLNLGTAYDRAGRLKEAEQEYITALKIHYEPETEMNLLVVRERIRLEGK